MRLFPKSKEYIKSLVTDDSGRPSLAKHILLLGAGTATAVVWKMAVIGNLNEAIFGLYLAFCMGHHAWSKYLDQKKAT